MCPSTSAIDLADMLIRAKDRVGGNPSQCLERLTALLGAAREKLARGTNVSKKIERRSRVSTEFPKAGNTCVALGWPLARPMEYDP